MRGQKLGTITIVVLKGRNLVNKEKGLLFKPNPYCVLKYDGQDSQTKVLNQKTQEPEWDDEMRFTVYAEDSTLDDDRYYNYGQPLPYERNLHLICYDRDERGDTIIGDATIDLTEALKIGEQDDWYVVTNRGVLGTGSWYGGEVYLEITHWRDPARIDIAEIPPPAKVKKTIAPRKPKRQEEMRFDSQSYPRNPTSSRQAYPEPFPQSTSPEEGYPGRPRDVYFDQTDPPSQPTLGGAPYIQEKRPQISALLPPSQSTPIGQVIEPPDTQPRKRRPSVVIVNGVRHLYTVVTPPPGYS